MENYAKLAKTMHMAGTLGLARCKELQKLVDIAEEERVFINNRTNRCKAGKGDYTKEQLNIDTAMFEARKKKIRNQLAVLSDPTLDTTAVDWDAPIEDSLEDVDVEATCTKYMLEDDSDKEVFMDSDDD